ncbi:MAG: hypothetical protein ACRBBN_15130 [Methyloligellaceae bacterium]
MARPFTFTNQFHQDVHHAVHNFDTHQYNVLFTNTQPLVSDAVLADLTEITPGDGYPAGGIALTKVSSIQTAGIFRHIVQDDVASASGGPIGPFQWVALYNVTQTTPLKPVVGWWDMGQPTTILDGDDWPMNFDDVEGIIRSPGS